MQAPAQPAAAEAPLRILTSAEIQQVRVGGVLHALAVLLSPPPPPPPPAAANAASTRRRPPLWRSHVVATLGLLQMLEENAKLIAALVENQNLGKLEECSE